MVTKQYKVKLCNHINGKWRSACDSNREDAYIISDLGRLTFQHDYDAFPR